MIWSWVAPRLPCMCGSATLAMVVSSACMIVASITETVMAPRWGVSCLRPNSAMEIFPGAYG